MHEDVVAFVQHQLSIVNSECTLTPGYSSYRVTSVSKHRGKIMNTFEFGPP